MDRSRYLIVVLSPRAAASGWVNKEVAHWLERRGPVQLLIVLAEGHLDWDEAAGRFDPDRSDAALPVLVGAAHESFLVNWPPLTGEIDAGNCPASAPCVENAASDWVAGGCDEGVLLQGRQLAKATVDIGAELKSATAVLVPALPARSSGNASDPVYAD